MPRVVASDDPRIRLLIEEALETGQTVIFPTDTIYGIGGNPWDERTLSRVRTLKQRAEGQPFTLHLPTVESISRYAQIPNERIRTMVHRLLPGPYTLLLEATPDAPPSAVQDGSIGIRVPGHPLFRDIMKELDRPLFGTSVNVHGQPPLSDINQIIDRFNTVDLVIIGETGTRASAIIDLTAVPPILVRGEASKDLLELPR